MSFSWLGRQKHCPLYCEGQGRALSRFLLNRLNLDNQMKLLSTAALNVALFLILTLEANAGLIQFDDGTKNSSIGAFYSGLGVEFTNASWRDNLGYPGASGTLAIGATDNGGLLNPLAYLSSHAVIATFASDMASISIDVLDVGDNGFRIDAFDSVAGGTLVDFDEALGTGFGPGNLDTLSVTGSVIRRIEMYQNFAVSNDGVFLDNLSFTASAVNVVPEPSAIAIWGVALICPFFFRRRLTEYLTQQRADCLRSLYQF